ncbi:MAG: HEAT repeat domain-containing protein [Candidatus Riflebacteria bacterium]|nr:HEAT repeat domain-containing protein [Candidatus Riflebacteria bacterium]
MANVDINSSLTEAFIQLKSKDEKVKTSAIQAFYSAMSDEIVSYLCEKYVDEDSLTRQRILEVFAFFRKKTKLTNDIIIKILKLLSVPEIIFPEFKDIFHGLDEIGIKPLQEFQCVTKDPQVHVLLKECIDATGLVDAIIKKWQAATPSQKIVMLDDFTKFQHPKIYPHIIEQLRDTPSKSDEKKLMYLRLISVLERFHDPQFMDFVLPELPNVEPGLWPPLFRALQVHGKVFFERLFDNFTAKPETFKWRTAFVLDEIVNLDAYSFIFPLLSEKSKRIPPLAKSIIEKTIKRFSLDFEKRRAATGKTESEVFQEIAFFTNPIRDFFSYNDPKLFPFLGEGLLRLGTLNEEILLENLFFIVSNSLDHLTNFLKIKDSDKRRSILIKAWCHKLPMTREGATIILKNCKEDYAGEVFDLLITEFAHLLPLDYREEAFKLANMLRPKEVLGRALQNKDPKIRAEIVKILGKNCGSEILPLLLSRKNDTDPQVKAVLIEILQAPMFSSPEATEALTDFLLDTDPGIVLKAIGIARNIDHPSALVKLNLLLAKAVLPAIKSSALNAITGLTRKKLFNNFEQMSNESRYSIVSSLVKLDVNFLNDMGRDFASDNSEKRRMAAKILALLCDTIPTEKVVDLETGVNNPDPFLRSIFAKILARIGKVNEIELLFKLMKDEDLRVKANAIEAIGIAKNNVQIEYVQQLMPMLTDTNHRVKANTLITLFRFAMLQPDGYLSEMLRQPNKNMHLAALFAIGEMPEVRFLPVLLNYLKNSDPDYRRNAVRSLGKFTNNYLAIENIRKLRFDPNEMVRRIVTEVLGKLEKLPGQI